MSRWRKARASENVDSCVELCSTSHTVALRDSKLRTASAVLTLTHSAAASLRTTLTPTQ